MKRTGTFKELIYTRCGAAYSIRGKEIPGNNGYAIFSSSTGLWSGLSDGDIQFAEKMIVRQFQWSYGCPPKQSWSYLLLPHGEEGAFTDMYAYTEEDGANNSEESNMRGSHLAQMLCGIMTMYPYELISSPYFYTRHQSSTDAFYLHECAPRLPEIAQDRIVPGAITPNAIQEFVRGREKLVQCSVAWLIQQMGLPAKNRRPIVILDQAKHIPLWIASITSRFPVSLARKLPFYTCRDGLERLHSSAFYRISTSSGEYAPQINMQDPDQESRALAMLLGCALEDKDAAQQISSLPSDASCVLLNGATGQMNFTPEGSILNSTFVLQIMSNRSFLVSVLSEIDELKDVPFSTDFLSLFDAVLALTMKAQPDLRELIFGIRTLQPYTDVKNGTINRILNSMLEQGEYTTHYALADAKKGYPLLGELIRLTEERSTYADHIKKIILACMRTSMGEPSTALPELWNRLKKSRVLMDYCIITLVGEERLSTVSPKEAQNIPEQNCAILLEMQNIYIQSCSKVSWDSIMTNPEPVMTTLLQRSVFSPELRTQLMNFLKVDLRAMEGYLVGGATLMGKAPKQRAEWWKILQEDGYPLEQQLQAIQRSKYLVAQDLEQAMIIAVQRQGFTSELQRLYHQYLSGTVDCGQAFFQETLHVVLARGGSAFGMQLEALWMAAQHGERSGARSRQLLMDIDKKIELIESQENEVLVLFVLTHAMDTHYSHTDAYQFIKQMTSKSHMSGLLHRSPKGIQNEWEKANPNFIWLWMDRDLAATSMGKALLEKLTYSSDELATHLLVLAGFRFENTDAYSNWVKSYVKRLFESKFSAKDMTLSSMCALNVILTDPRTPVSDGLLKPITSIVQQAGDNFVQKNMDYLIYCYVQKLSEEKRTVSFAERWERDCAANYGEAAAKLLKDCANQAITAYQQNNKGQGGLFNRLFCRGKIEGGKKHDPEL